jgi:hypothetical protein
MTSSRPFRLAGIIILLGACGDRMTGDATADPPPDATAPADSASATVSPSSPAPQAPAFVTDSAPASDSTAAGDSTSAIRSVYTSLAEPACRVVRRDEETGGTTSRCPGTAGYTLMVHDDDARMSIDVVAPGGRTHRLRYWAVITSAFSSLGPRAEWRMRGGTPIALIVRVNAFENPEVPDRATSYLAVAKITARETCVTDRIPPGADANEAARRAADQSASRPCRPGPG